jgi:hypothetical protein
MWPGWERKQTYTKFWWGLLGKQPGGRPRRWDKNIKMDHMEIGCKVIG